VSEIESGNSKYQQFKRIAEQLSEQRRSKLEESRASVERKAKEVDASFAEMTASDDPDIQELGRILRQGVEDLVKRYQAEEK
jgi:hypothetical protein